MKHVTGRDEKEELAERDLLLEVNAHVHEAASRFEGVLPGQERWDFTCECGAPVCRFTVSLTLAEYEAHYNGRRPHRSRQLRPPRPGHPPADLSKKRIQRRPLLGGLINEYERVA